MNVKSTDSNPAFVAATVVDLPDDNGVKLDVTQPVYVRVGSRPAAAATLYYGKRGTAHRRAL